MGIGSIPWHIDRLLPNMLRMCLKNFAGVPEGQPTGHVFDGIEELNNPLPKWWSNFFLITILWGFFYIAVYGLGWLERLFWLAELKPRHFEFSRV